MPSFTKMFQLHEPVQFTPCVERTILSCCHLLRYISSESRGRGLSSVQSSLIRFPGLICFNLSNSLFLLSIRFTSFMLCFDRIKPVAQDPETAFSLFKFLEEYFQTWNIGGDQNQAFKRFI